MNQNLASNQSLEKLAGQPVGRRLRIVGYKLAADLEQRLLEMGMTLGTECTVLRYAPLGDPLELKVRGYCLSLRATEAEGVQVQPLA
ncbi:MAG TPA: ferrous iron transport protein A [Clostridia bacterium]|nr:ferrous iron transport protein A [Clostridia bacterium]